MSAAVTLKTENFGELTDDAGRAVSVQKFTWQTGAGLRLSVLNLDAAIIELCVPDRSRQNAVNVLLAVDNLDEYLQLDPTIVCGAHFEKDWPALSGNGRRLEPGTGRRVIDGGRMWDCFVDQTRLHLSLMRKPPTQRRSVTFATITISVEPANVVRIQYQTCGANGGQFRVAHRFLLNLAGAESGARGTYEHVVQLNADTYIDEAHNLRASVENIADLRIAQHLGLSLYKAHQEGAQNSPRIGGIYAVNNACQDGFALRLIHTGSGRALELYSDFPWLHFSTLDHLPPAKDTIVPFYPREGIERVSLIFALDEFILSVVNSAEEEQPSVQTEQDGAWDEKDEIPEQEATACGAKFQKNNGFLIHPMACTFRSKDQESIATETRERCPSHDHHASAPVGPFVGHVTLKFGICKPLQPEDR
uniref:Aldose 1-epimerase n=1 Tax=Anopheles farauti TaxID=69004 RepID=A0A182QQH4_9DIPT